MSEARLHRTRESLPEGYQFGQLATKSVRSLTFDECVAEAHRFERWFRQVCAEDINPAGLWKVESIAREAFLAGAAK